MFRFAIASLLVASPAVAAPVYFALGDSITFGETDLFYRQSSGDQGYVSLVADSYSARNGGSRPTVVDFAIDGETAESFQDGSGRTPPVVDRTDVPLALQNLNYAGQPATPQRTQFQTRAASAIANGDAIQAITITLGFNELGAIAADPNALALLPGVLDIYRSTEAANLAFVRDIAPAADLYLLGYYNPFPGDPANPANAFFAVAGPQLNDIVKELAALFQAQYVDVAPGFVGREAELTYIDEQPDGFYRDGPYPGVEPLGNVHPNAAGYRVIADAIVAAYPTPVATPEPAALALLGFGAAVLALARRRAA